ncbi:MAG: HD domain-containing protein [Anaerolineales bacterium]|nr:HD domain-containing protein [Anaerolineales bacterium]
MSGKLSLSPLVGKIAELLAGKSVELGGIYLVGGAVRDGLLGWSSHDLDFVVNEDSLETGRKVADALGGAYFTLDEEFQVGRVVLTPENQPRQIFDFVKLQGKDLVDDLQNRDFSINAMAVSLAEMDTLIDPLGGASDLLQRRLNACSEESLRSDPVRVLRAVRMSAKYQLAIAPKTRQLIVESVPSLVDVSAERLRDELFKILDSPRPSASLRILDRLGAMEIILPEIAELKTVSHAPPHIYDLWEHTLHTVEGLEEILQLLDEHYVHDNQSGGDLFSGLVSQRLGRYRKQISAHMAEELVPERTARPLIFLAALLHDITKPAHLTVEEGGRIRFTGHEASGAEFAAHFGARLKLSRAEIHRLRRTIADHARPWYLAKLEAGPSKKAIYHFWRDNRDTGIDICLLELADLRGVYGYTLSKEIMEQHLDAVRTLLEGYFETPQLALPKALLDGNALIARLGIKPGPVVGEVLNALIEAQVEGEVQTREQALEFAAEYLSNLNEN